ncbi:MAG: MlaD family protein [Muribaculaceae bacterium]|nr:MlaD family protein [Muribaculaceae bacterium]
MSRIIRKETVIGACTVIAICILFFGIEYLKGINIFKPANYYYVSYTNVNGLAISSPVTVNGFKVGLVHDIQYEYDNPGHVLVELNLDKKLRIPKGTIAMIQSDLLGTASVVLQMGTAPDAHPVGDHLIGKTDAGMMGAIGESLLPSVESIIPKVDTLLVSVNRLTSDSSLLAAIGRLDAISRSIDRTRRNIDASVAKLPGTMDNVNGITSNINQISQNLATVSDELKGLPLKSMMEKANTTMANLSQVTGELNNPNSTLGLLLHDRALYDNLNSAMADLDSLFVDIKRSPKRYISIKLL